MTPPSMNTSVSPTSRANDISCVTTTMVMPLCGQVAHDVEHLADQLRVERRGGLVEEHQLGLHRQGAGDRDALLLAAGQLVGVDVHLVAEADAVEQAPAALDGDGRRSRASPAAGASMTFSQRRHVREEVEALEHHADLAALAAHLAVAQLVQLVAALLVADQLTVDVEPCRRRSSRGG